MGLFSTSGDADKKPFLHHLPHPQKHCYELKLRNNQFHPACSHTDHFVQVLELLLKLTNKYEPAKASKHWRKSHGGRNQRQYSQYWIWICVCLYHLAKFAQSEILESAPSSQVRVALEFNPIVVSHQCHHHYIPNQHPLPHHRLIMYQRQQLRPFSLVPMLRASSSSPISPWSGEQLVTISWWSALSSSPSSSDGVGVALELNPMVVSTQGHHATFTIYCISVFCGIRLFSC